MNFGNFRQAGLQATRFAVLDPSVWDKQRQMPQTIHPVNPPETIGMPSEFVRATFCKDHSATAFNLLPENIHSQTINGIFQARKTPFDCDYRDRAAP